MTFPEGCIVAGQNRVQGQCDAAACNYPFCEASGTRTGRWPSEPEMQELTGRGPEVIVIGVDTDFAEIEMRMLAALADPEVTSIMLDLHPPCELLGKHDLLAEMVKDMPVKEAELRPAPGYLQHDPTKNVKRRRR